MKDDVKKILSRLSSPRNATIYGLAENKDWENVKDFASDCGITQSEMITVLWGEFNDKYQDFTRDQVVLMIKSK